MKILTPLIFLVFTFPAFGSMQALYLQGFSNDSGSSQTVQDYGWFAWDGNETSRGNLTSISNRVTTFSGPNAVENINALAPYGDNVTQGFVSLNSSRNQFHFTELSIPRIYEDITLSVLFRVDNAHSSRFALQFDGGEWMAANEVFSTTTSGTDWSEFSLTLQSNTEFTRLDFAPGILALSSDNPESLGSIAGSITGVGIFTDGLSGNYRFDDFSVSAVIPEPSTYALVVGIGVLAIVIYRRKKAV